MLVTAAHLRAIDPKVARPDEFARALSEVLPRYDITTPPRVAAFISQAMHESGAFARLEESLSYSAERMVAVWPTRFRKRDALGVEIRGRDGKPLVDLELAKRLERNPRALGSYVYANRMGNGDEASGDGYTFRGRGFGLTGRANYRDAGDAIGKPLEQFPELVADPKIAVETFAWFWRSRGLNAARYDGNVDAVSDIINIGRATPKVGDAHGYADRLARFDRASEVFA